MAYYMLGHERTLEAASCLYICIHIYIYMHLLYKDTAETNRSLLTWIQGSFSKEWDAGTGFNLNSRQKKSTRDHVHQVLDSMTLRSKINKLYVHWSQNPLLIVTISGVLVVHHFSGLHLTTVFTACRMPHCFSVPRFVQPAFFIHALGSAKQCGGKNTL